MNHCHICCGKNDEDGLYHSTCLRRFYGSTQLPELPFSLNDLNELAAQIVRSRVSVPGVQPKLSLHLERRGAAPGRFTLMDLGGEYILKPPSQEYPELPELEHLTMKLAEVSGLTVVPYALFVMQDGTVCYITKRIDRFKGEKIHMEDMAQLTDKLTEQKYLGSMEQVGKAVRRWTTHPLLEAQKLLELTIFCYLTGNSDMHLKNFSLLYERTGKIILAPAYDLVPVCLVLPEDKDELALSLNGRKRKLRRSDFEKFAAYLGLSQRQSANLFRRMSGKIGKVLETVPNGFASTQTLERYRSLIEQRSAILT